MAEGYMRALYPSWEVYSAGTSPVGINPRAVAVMLEDGVDISHQTSDSIDPGLLARMTLAVTLCGDARETCPLTPASVTRLHWPLSDPAKATGTEEEVMAEFRRTRDEIRRRVEELGRSTVSRPS